MSHKQDIYLLHRIGVPPGAEDIYRLARQHRYSRQAAIELCNREIAPREKMAGPTLSLRSSLGAVRERV